MSYFVVEELGAEDLVLRGGRVEELLHEVGCTLERAQMSMLGLCCSLRMSVLAFCLSEAEGCWSSENMFRNLAWSVLTIWS